MFCSKKCYGEAYRKRLITNKAWFLKGQQSLNKGRTLESWVGEERAKEIRAKMSLNSKGKADFLRALNKNKDFLAKRAASRWFHERVVKAIIDDLRAKGKRCFALSEYVREQRIPDAIIFDDSQLVALEIEQEKRYKPTKETIVERLSTLNRLCGFFDETLVVFVPKDAPITEMVREVADHFLPKD